MRQRFKKNDLVLIDPENRVRDRMIQGSLTGIVVEAGIFKSKVFSQQTFVIITIPNRYLYNIERANSADLSHLAFIRDTAPLFSLSEIMQLEAVMGELNKESSKEIIKNVIIKAQDHMIGNVFLEVEAAKSDTHTFQSIPSVFNRYLTDDVFEQLESCIEARGNLDLAKEAGVFEKGKEEQLKRHVETIYALIAQNFREITKTNPDTFTYMKVFNDILDESEPADIVLEILSLVVDLVPKSQVDTAFIALNTIKVQRQSDEILDVIRYGMSKLRQMGATAKEFDEEEYFDSENEVDSEATYDAMRGMSEYMKRFFFGGLNSDEEDDDEEET